MKETRRINVYVPAEYAANSDTRYPVLYMPDGGLQEDFLHVADAVHAGAMWQVLRPMIVVGVENTVRRRDLAPATEIEEEKKAAPQAGGTAQFRAFLREELIPLIRERYRTSEASAIVGESLAGLFVVETFLVEPQLFDTYIAISPSVQWNRRAVLANSNSQIKEMAALKKTLYLTSANEEEIVAGVEALVATLKSEASPNLTWHYHPMPTEFHDTIYRAASPRAFRVLFPMPAPTP